MTALFESLTLKLTNVVELATQDQGPLTPQARQTLVRSTKEFKDALKEAHDYATTLPGGDHSVEEQDEVIEMLEKLKERKRCQLAEFADRVGRISSSQVNMNMEVDSTASTPA
ncbi:hypothetical protein BD311DRAFT_667813 [Dichomitus squalens]|uniref:Mediator of RNA polymerase II transcription subunit 9 n=1 Tax=Dichomitus squalens TaxID=114155 RepID=A0A4Q9MK62_9APHY|nr:hypothetical protein BD311DRAFT_667813 [Dichomitus squalens]